MSQGSGPHPPGVGVFQGPPLPASPEGHLIQVTCLPLSVVGSRYFNVTDTMGCAGSTLDTGDNKREGPWGCPFLLR